MILKVYEPNKLILEVQGTQKEFKKILEGLTWNDSMEIFILRKEYDIKYYVKYEEEFTYLKEIL